MIFGLGIEDLDTDNLSCLYLKVAGNCINSLAGLCRPGFQDLMGGVKLDGGMITHAFDCRTPRIRLRRTSGNSLHSFVGFLKSFKEEYSNMKLDKMLAKACTFAQYHIDDQEAWPPDEVDREMLLQCTSYQVACFLAQHTRDGRHGVEWSVIIDELVEHPMKSQKQWRKIINDLAADLGGWLVSKPNGRPLGRRVSDVPSRPLL